MHVIYINPISVKSWTKSVQSRCLFEMLDRYPVFKAFSSLAPGKKNIHQTQLTNAPLLLTTGASLILLCLTYFWQILSDSPLRFCGCRSLSPVQCMHLVQALLIALSELKTKSQIQSINQSINQSVKQ